ncbi:ATP-binding protein [Catenulispora subtropica]|uniref:histidine kinase n=1 Tax=Catenulispora subtropica TaxID=450798 RepID=A0ABP5DP83_9ACTN
MITADGVEEAPRIGPGAPGRHAAWGVAGERRTGARRPAAWVVAPSVCSAVLAGAAVAIVVDGAQSAGYHIGGGTMVAVWVLGFLILAVVVGTLAFAGRSAREDELRHRAPGSPAYAPQQYAHPQPVPPAPPMPAPPPEVAASAAEAAAVMAAVNAPANPAGTSTAVVSEEGVDLQVIFAQLVRRLLTLVLQQINRLDELENEVEDPKLLKSLFGIDHQATQVRRYGENIGVLVGAMPQRQWTQPVPVTVAQRSAVSETPDYPRVQVIPRAPGRIHGHAVSDVIHILSELVENATNYSNPNTKVTVGAHRVAAGLAIEIDDHGIGMEPDQIRRLNTLLRDPSGANVRDLLSQGRIGLSVVAKMAQRHGIAVELQPNVTGGTMALVVIPDALLAPEEQPAGDRGKPRRGVDTTQLPAKPALAPIAADRAAQGAPGSFSSAGSAGAVGAVGAAGPASPPGSAATLSPVVSPLPPKPQPPGRSPSRPRPEPVTTPRPVTGRYAAQPAPPEVPPPLPRHEEPGPEAGPALLPDGRPQLRRRTPQGHISARLLQADDTQPQYGAGALSPTMMSDFWQGLSAGSEGTPAPVPPGLSFPSLSDPAAGRRPESGRVWAPAPGPDPSAPAPARPAAPDYAQDYAPDYAPHDRPTVNRQEWNQ